MDILKIKDLEIPIEIKNYKNSKSVKIYFKGNVLQINKPTRLSKKTLTRILKDEEDGIYDKYKKILDSEVNSIKQWKTGEKIYYKGEEFTVIREETKLSRISIELKTEVKELIVKVPKDIDQNLIKEYDESIDDPVVNSQDHHDIARDMEEWIPKIRAQATSVIVT